MAAISVTAPRRAQPEPRPAPATGPDLRVVGERARRGRAGVLAAVVIGVFIALFCSAILHTVLVSGQHRLDGMQSEIEDRQSENHRLRLRADRLESSGRIVEAATRDGMVRPDEITWLAPGPEAPAPPPVAGADTDGSG